ncbi:MAG: DUF4417 domain-containing protein [Bacilli bacterium]|nr:DUF4417 domain-containing protein [Bacilli bacterium]
MILKDKNRLRKSDGDVFLAQKLKNANFNTGFYQVPEIDDVELDKPEDLVLWSIRHRCKNKSKCGLVFYEFDSKFDGRDGIYNILKYGTEERVNQLIAELKEFAFVVCPDYSVYGNFPNYKQIDALSRSREVGYILSTYGIKVVVNYRATFEWTYELALTGICYNGIVAIGTLGCLRDNESRTLLKDSVHKLVEYIRPRVIIVYGYAPEDIFKCATDSGCEIWQFDSLISKAFNGGK